MSLIESSPFVLGIAAPTFSLPDTVSGKHVSLDNARGTNGTVVMFICNHCPYVVHVNEALVSLAKDYSERGIGFVAISSNDATLYPEDGPDAMKQYAERLGYPFPYLYDESQDTARAYDARCTPDVFVFDAKLKLVYHGQVDDSRPKSGRPATGADVRNALEALLNDKPALPDQVPSIGCNIKWRVA